MYKVNDRLPKQETINKEKIVWQWFGVIVGLLFLLMIMGSC